MADADNIEKHLRYELNPPADSPTGTLLSQLKHRHVEEYAKQLRGEYAAPGEKRDAAIAKFKDDFDDKIVARMTKGAENEKADASAYQVPDAGDEQKQTGIKGVFNVIMSLVLGMFGPIGHALGGILHTMGFDNLAAKFMSDKTSDQSPEEKEAQQRAAGITASLEGNISLTSSIDLSVTDEEKAKLFRQMQEKDFDAPVPNPVRARAQAAEVPPVTMPGSGAEPASEADNHSPDAVSDKNVNSNNIGSGQGNAVVAPS